MVEMIQQWSRELGVASEVLALGIGTFIGLILPKLFRSRTHNARTFGPAPHTTHRAQASFNTSVSVGTGTGAAPLTRSSGSMNINGHQIAISPEKLAEFRQLIQRGKILKAIKLIREISNLSLAEAKAVAEALKKDQFK